MIHTRTWIGRRFLPERHGQLCRLLLARRGKFLLEFMDTSIKSPGDVSRRFDMPVLGMVPHLDDVDEEYALRVPITLSLGSLITICHNGIITGEYIMRKKHTLNLDLEQELFSAIRDTTVQYAGVKQDIDHMRVTDLFGDYERLLVAGARKNVYPWSWIGKIDKEYSAPSEDNPECKDYLGTRWGLYNAFNYVMRDATPQRQAESLYRFMGIMN